MIVAYVASEQRANERASAPSGGGEQWEDIGASLEPGPCHPGSLAYDRCDWLTGQAAAWRSMLRLGRSAGLPATVAALHAYGGVLSGRNGEGQNSPLHGLDP